MSKAELDLKQLKLMEKRFTDLSYSRLERMLAGFSIAQSDCIQLIPLLFHVNHPMLPGYVDKQTPCGLPNYSPDKTVKSIAKTISRSFKYQSRAYLQYQVLGLYLMGSSGTLGQSIKSDLDLWVVIDPGMELIDRDRIYRKSKNISQWLASKGVELNCYLVGESDFRVNKSKPLSKENCGDTQNFLLLDEFYRTAIWLCGRKPLWWMVPANENYAEFSTRLIKQRYLHRADWIDFGEVASIPASEYFSASLWQLYKSIESPYKSLLKLLLLEVYARHVEETDLISQQYKALVYEQDPKQAIIDPYLLLFEYAENFIKDQPVRLEFLRRAFYLKSGVKVSLQEKKVVGWKNKAINQLVKDWGWNQERLNYLNQRSQWQIDKVLKERVDLVRELNHSYHFLANFARIKGVADQVSQNELLSLGRKLYSVFEKRPGKIETINTGIVNDLSESTITLFNSNEGDEWHLYLDAVSRYQIPVYKAVKKSNSYFELIAWCVCNRIATRATNIQVLSQNGFYSQSLMQQIHRKLLSLINNKEAVIEDFAFQSPAMINQVCIFLNTEKDPLAAEKTAGIYSVADHLDYFSWGESKTNLLDQFETFITNSWGENVCKLYKGDNAWIQFFEDSREIISDLDSKLTIVNQHIPQSSRLTRRVIALLKQWGSLAINALKKHKEYRFIMANGSGYMSFLFNPDGTSSLKYKDLSALLTSLGKRSNYEFDWVIDENLTLPEHIIRIINRKSDNNLNCYLVKTGLDSTEVYIKDLEGHIFYQKKYNSLPMHVVHYYQQFLDSINLSNGFLPEKTTFTQFWFADITQKKEAFRFSKIKQNPSSIAKNYWSIKAIAHFNTENEVCFDLASNNAVFLHKEIGELVYRKLAQHITSTRKGGGNYPIYITDIDLSGVSQNPELPDYFKYKQMIELKLSRAMVQVG